MRRSWVRNLAVVVLGASILGWLATGLLFDGYSIPSLANEPALHPGDHVLVRPGHAAHLDDLVLYHPPTDEVAKAISRVVGVGGDRLSSRGDQLVRNGTVAHDGKARGATSLEQPITVPKGTVFLMGDNRSNSQDSRYFGPVSLSDVNGRVVSTQGRLVLAFPVVAALAGLALALTFRKRPTST